MSVISSKKPLDIASLNSVATEEGFCLLYDATKKGSSWLGLKAIKKHTNIPEKIKNPVIGYLAYPNPTLNNDIPNLIFYEFERLLEFKKYKNKLTLKECYKTEGKLQRSVTKVEYLKNINKIKELLLAGEIYQLNYAIRFRKGFKGNPYDLFLKLTETNPASFSSFINGGDFQILSASPESLFKIKKRFIASQPIKGTIDKREGGKKLLKSEKDHAELDMITDLERNDLGKICEYGSVKVEKERALLEMKNLYHTYSEISGKLRQKIGMTEIVRAMFPGGSVTGCPKIRAMRYIEKLEAVPRNIFTGSIGYIDNSHHLMESHFNIAIRTMLIRKGYIEFWAGGGIVADSDPEKEYEECLLKAEKLIEAL